MFVPKHSLSSFKIQRRGFKETEKTCQCHNEFSMFPVECGIVVVVRHCCCCAALLLLCGIVVVVRHSCCCAAFLPHVGPSRERSFDIDVKPGNVLLRREWLWFNLHQKHGQTVEKRILVDSICALLLLLLLFASQFQPRASVKTWPSGLT